MAHMLLEGREGVAQDCNRAFELVEAGARLGCHHCQGVMAWCYFTGWGCVCVKDAARSLELARESSGKGSRYGQFVLGLFYEFGVGGVAQDDAQALALYRLAAAQNLDEAQFSLGRKSNYGCVSVQENAKALSLFKPAAAQGHPHAMMLVGEFYSCGLGVRRNQVEAIRWYRRAQAAGDPHAAAALERLRA